MKKFRLVIWAGCFIAGPLTHENSFAQSTNDSTEAKHIYLKEITLVGKNSRVDIHQMPEIVGTSIFAGKKNSLIVIDNLNANIVTNNMRQVMAKVPGIHSWESDGSGIQIGVAARGLSPNRSWEFNVRQNGYDISSDPFGYPEAYYTPQLQAVQRLQVVRGAGALQYGPQFGGMLNFILRDGSDIQKPIELESQNTAGSFGLFNSYTALGGKSKNLHYYAFYDHRNADGWRENSRYRVNTGFATVNYQVSPKLKLGIEMTRWNMRSQQPGGLTDKQFHEDAQKSFRARNWFDIDWNTIAMTALYQINEKQRLDVKAFHLKGDRNSVGYMKSIVLPDSINPATGTFTNRQLDIDRYRNWGAEARYLLEYKTGRRNSHLSAGIRYFRGETERLRNGVGSTGSDYDMGTDKAYPTDLALVSNNLAFFAENLFRITDKFVIVPGFRVEHLQTSADGRLGYNPDNSEIRINRESRTRNFILFGVGAEYHTSKTTEIYANVTQSYRPMLFSDLTASPTTDVIDPNLSDSKGYSMEAGFRGKWKNYLQFDAGIFWLQYNNRIGSITQLRPDGTSYLYRTNVADSRSRGIETMIEFNPILAWVKKSNFGSVGIFASYAYTDARYEDFLVINKQGNDLVETNLKNNRVENAPEHILRTGLTYYLKSFSLTTQFSHTSKMYTDANNTVTAAANGQNGLIPSFTVVDISGTYRMKDKYTFRAGINNVTDKRYFTRRAGGYPGPGLLPADARNFYVTVGIRI